MSDQNLNPQIKSIQVGVRHTRELKIYPLSVKDQFELTKEIVDSVNEIVATFDGLKDEIQAVSALSEIISKNLTKILKYVCDSDQIPTMEELTNAQLGEIAVIVFEVNYEGLIKNFKDLFKRGKDLFPKIQLPPVEKPRRTK